MEEELRLRSQKTVWYKIDRVSYADGTIYYRVFRKRWWWWKLLTHESCGREFVSYYETFDAANDRVQREIANNHRRMKVTEISRFRA